MARDTSVNVRITAELRAKLEKLAADDDRTLSSFVEKILREYVAEREKPKRR
jgi:predicted transcriptional regulator